MIGGAEERMDFDATRAWLKAPDFFHRFRVPATADRLSELGLPDDELVALVERGGERRALLVRQLCYHHVAEGELAGEAFVVSF